MAESLKVFQKRVNYAGELFVFEKALDNMRDPTVEEYNALPPNIKAQYPNYGAYVAAIKQQNSVTKLAIKDKILLLIADCNNSSFTAAEKGQYVSDMQSVQAKCNDNK